MLREASYLLSKTYVSHIIYRKRASVISILSGKSSINGKNGKVIGKKEEKRKKERKKERRKERREMDPFSNIIKPLPFGEAVLKALGVALRMAPTLATINYMLFLTWEIYRRDWVQRVLETRPCQWLMGHIWYPRTVRWFVTSMILLIGFIGWFWILLLVKHAQICILGALPCGPCPVITQAWMLPLEALLGSFCLLDHFIRALYEDMNTFAMNSIARTLETIQSVGNGGGVTGNLGSRRVRFADGSGLGGSGDAPSTPSG